MDETQAEREALERMNAPLKRLHMSGHKPHEKDKKAKIAKENPTPSVGRKK